MPVPTFEMTVQKSAGKGITRSQHIPRIQEAQATQYHVLRSLIGDLLGP